MKKSLIIALGVVMFGAIVFAAPSYVTDFTAKNTGESVSYTEFNTLVKTIKGVFSQRFSNHNVGINTTPSTEAILKFNGLVKIVPMKTADRPTCDSSIGGSVYADSDDGHLWGCNETAWVQLDTAEPLCN